MNAADFQKRYGSAAQGTVKEPKAQIRLPKQPQPNKTEAAWMEQAKRRHPGCFAVLYEPFTLRLPSGCKYTPDVVVVTSEFTLAIYEVKGAHIHNQRSIHAFKEAKAAFPFWTFHFAQLTKAGWAVA